MQEAIREACLSSGIVYHLDLSWDSWLDRFEALIDTRPILQSKSLPEVEEMFNSRKLVYAENHHTVSVDTQTPEQIAEAIAQQIQAGWTHEG